MKTSRKFMFSSRALVAACLLACVWIVLTAINAFLHTGIVSMRSSDPHAGLIITQDSHQAVLAGVGQARIRLKPGVYQVSASDNGKEDSSTVTVTKQHTVTVSLNPAVSTKIPTLSDVAFTGTSAFLKFGMPSSQLDNLRRAFFQYSQNIKKVAINENSISFAPHNPNNLSTLSVVSFSVAVDNQSFNATINYDNLGNGFQLLLYSHGGGIQVFDSNQGDSLGNND